MRFNTLSGWLDWQNTLNPAEIELGLERVNRVLSNAGLKNTFSCPLITIAGTNGKGSVVAMIESITRAAGYRTCTYSSPHISHYNERIRINGVNIDDKALCESFEKIDQARGKEQLTYFEFGTVAAIELFSRSGADLIIMEVGLGGRLDAVNIMHPDVAVITSIDIDHTEWLGNDRHSIALEKSGIFRQGIPVICAEMDPPQSLLKQADKLQVQLAVSGQDYRIEDNGSDWDLLTSKKTYHSLSHPGLSGEFQLHNAAASVLALLALEDKIQINSKQINRGLETVYLAGRFECLATQPDVIVDVAHNPQAASKLVDLLRIQQQAGKTHAVIAMLADKQIDEFIKILSKEVDYWYCAGLGEYERGASESEMSTIVERNIPNVKLFTEDTVEKAYECAMENAADDDRIVITGSFYTVSKVCELIKQDNIIAMKKLS